MTLSEYRSNLFLDDAEPKSIRNFEDISKSHKFDDPAKHAALIAFLKKELQAERKPLLENRARSTDADAELQSRYDERKKIRVALDEIDDEIKAVRNQIQSLRSQIESLNSDLAGADPDQQPGIHETYDLTLTELQNVENQENTLTLERKEIVQVQEGNEQEIDSLENVSKVHLESYKQSLESLTDRVDELREATDASVKHIVREVMPPDNATEDGDYFIESALHQPPSRDEYLKKLGHKKDSKQVNDSGKKDPKNADGKCWDKYKFRLNKQALEQDCNKLLGILTAKRIAEEMDTATYLDQVHSAFRRIKKEADRQVTQLENCRSKVGRAGTRLELCITISETLRKFAQENLTPETTNNISDSKTKPPRILVQESTDLLKFSRNCVDFSNALDRHLNENVKNLTRLSGKFCAESNIMGVVGHCERISRQIEKYSYFFPFPFLSSLAVLILVKMILALNTWEAIHNIALPILGASFVISWGLWILIGYLFRKSSMEYLLKRTSEQICAILNARRSRDRDVKFPSIPLKQSSIGSTDTTPFDYERQQRGAPWWMPVYVFRHREKFVTAFLFLIFILLPLYLLVQGGSDNKRILIISKPATVNPCVLGEGRLVFATSDSYFLREMKEDGEWSKGVWDYIVPEMHANVVPRQDVIGVRPATDKDSELHNCTDTDPDHNKFNLTHIGDPTNDPNVIVQFGELAVSYNELAEKFRDFPPNFGNGEAVEPVIVTPIVNHIPNGAANTPVAGDDLQSFSTIVTLVDQKNNIQTLDNTIILPFFPIRMATGKVNDTKEAFNWGADVKKFSDPALPKGSPHPNFFSGIAAALQECLQRNDELKLKLDVMGLASDSWAGDTGGHDINNLNFHLAEGRRFAILKMLQAEITDSSIQERLLIRAINDKWPSLDTLVSKVQDGFPSDFFDTYRRFEGPEEFRDTRGDIIPITGPADREKDPLQELFARSAVISMETEGNAFCSQ